MRYKVGDKVKIKSLDWYKTYKDECDVIYCGDILFIKSMSKYCGKVLTIDRIFNFNTTTYEMLEDPNGFNWTDDMIECLVEPAMMNESSKMVSLDNVCRWLDNINTDNYMDSGLFQMYDLIRDLRKDMGE